MRKFIITAEMRDLEKQVLQEEISYSRMIELLCEKAQQWHQKKLDGTLSIGQKVYHKDIYDGKELMEVVGIRKTQVELEGDYSGGTHNVCQKDWVSIEGIILQSSCSCDKGIINCPGCKDADELDKAKYICAGCKGKGIVTCGKCGGDGNDKSSFIKASAKSIAESRENAFLDMALKYMKEYESTPWWRFGKRSLAKSKWHSARECAVRFGL